MIKTSLVALVLVSLVSSGAIAFSTPRSFSLKHCTPTKFTLPNRLQSSASSSTTTTSGNGLAGVDEFESWFRQCKGSKCDERIAHAVFGGRLRGLAWKGDSANAEGPLATVPSAIVLQANEAQPNWDANLASKLWKQVLQGSRSSLYGYICLLTQGPWEASTTTTPPSTSPNALRHWTTAQRQALANACPKGQKVLDLHDQQQADWQAKYQQLAAEDRPATFEQFSWAMEVVHSRAFRGVNQSVGSILPALLAPVVAAAAGWAYFSSTPFPNEAVFYGLGLMAMLPFLYNLVATNGGAQSSVVLLPLIDSANHLEAAGSSIEYDPLTSAFELTLQPNCIVSEGNNEDNGTQQQQLYISYGAKKDTELLLNYGFLPGASGGQGGDDDEAALQAQRQDLVELFLRRNG